MPAVEPLQLGDTRFKLEEADRGAAGGCTPALTRCTVPVAIGGRPSPRAPWPGLTSNPPAPCPRSGLSNSAGSTACWGR
jgi:hypothetical protein